MPIPPLPPFHLRSVATSLLLFLSAAAFTACHSGPPRDPQGGPPRVHVPTMEAAGKFFEGQIAATVHFGRARFPGAPGGPAGKDRDSRPGGRGPRGGGGGGFSAGAGMGPAGMGMGGGGGGGFGSDRGPGGSPVGGRARTENNPAVQLTLSVTNQSADPLEIEVLEFNSLLGNFVVLPAKVSLAPGQTAAFDPMTSRLGIPQGDLPIKVRLRHGDKTDEQSLLLKRVPEDTPAAP